MENSSGAHAPKDVQRKSSLARGLVPSIVLINRAHLLMLFDRHVALLQAELSSSDGIARQVQLLQREPLLLLLVGLQAALRVDVTGSCIADLAPALQSMFLEPPQPELRGRKYGVVKYGVVRRQSTLLSKDESVDVSDTISKADVESSDAINPPDVDFLKTPAVGFERQISLTPFVPIMDRQAGRVRNTYSFHRLSEDCSSPDAAVWARYSHLKIIGAGHFGEVVSAQEKVSGQIVAIKRFERQDARHDGDEESGEGRIINALSHPNLIRILEVVECLDEFFYCNGVRIWFHTY